MTISTTTPTREHLLAVVEPTPDGDTTLDLAHDVAERGGAVSLVLVITPRVRQDIAAFAAGADLTLGEAEAIALDQFTLACEQQIGVSASTTIVHSSSDGRDVRRFLSPDTTAIAIPEQLTNGRSVRRITDQTGIPVVVTPRRAT